MIETEFARCIAEWDLLPEDLIFLVGAGISVDSPSNVPSVENIREAIFTSIFYSLQGRSYGDIDLSMVRFETLISKFKRFFDPKFEIVEFFAQFDHPNQNHHFFAQMINEGAQVLTTNFDLLIEHALNQCHLDARVIITKKDYRRERKILRRHSRSDSNSKLGRLVKLHGCHKNFFTEEDTRESLIETIEKLGKHNSADEFELETYKIKLLEPLLRDKTLIVAGYSGGDNLDLMPSLINLSNFKRILWIRHHSDKEPNKTEIIKIDPGIKLQSSLNTLLSGEVNTVERMLKNLAYLNGIESLLINTHTSQFLCGEEKSYDGDQKPSSTIRSFSQWLAQKEYIQQASAWIKYIFLARLCYLYSQFSTAVNILRYVVQKPPLNHAPKINLRMYPISERLDIIELCYEFAANVYELGDMDEAERWFQITFDLLSKLSPKLKADKAHKDMIFSELFSTMGMLKMDLGELEESRELLTWGIKYAKKTKDPARILLSTNNMGVLTMDLPKEKQKSLRYFSNAAKMARKTGDLHIICALIGNQGIVHMDLGQYHEAEKKILASIDLSRKILDLHSVGDDMGNLGLLYFYTGKFEQAYPLLTQSLEISTMLGDTQALADDFSNLALFFTLTNQYDVAHEYFEKAINRSNQVQDKTELGNIHGNRGLVALFTNNFEKAKEYWGLALNLFLGNDYTQGIATSRFNLGIWYYFQHRFHKALREIQTAHDHFENLDLFHEIRVSKMWLKIVQNAAHQSSPFKKTTPDLKKYQYPNMIWFL